MADTQTHDWECNTCGQQEAVENGVCPKCGPTQTTPLSTEAKKEAGVEVAEPTEAVVDEEVQDEAGLSELK